jgi:hypothetical protein
MRYFSPSKHVLLFQVNRTNDRLCGHGRPVVLVRSYWNLGGFRLRIAFLQQFETFLSTVGEIVETLVLGRLYQSVEVDAGAAFD